MINYQYSINFLKRFFFGSEMQRICEKKSPRWGTLLHKALVPKLKDFKSQLEWWKEMWILFWSWRNLFRGRNLKGWSWLFELEKTKRHFDPACRRNYLLQNGYWENVQKWVARNRSQFNLERYKCIFYVLLEFSQRVYK